MLLYRKVLLCTTYDLLRWDSIFTCTFYSFIFLRCLLIIVKNDLQYIHGYCCEKLEEIKLKFCVFIRMSDIYKPYAHKKIWTIAFDSVTYMPILASFHSGISHGNLGSLFLPIWLWVLWWSYASYCMQNWCCNLCLDVLFI